MPSRPTTSSVGDPLPLLIPPPFLSALRDSFPLFYPIPEVTLRSTSGYHLPSLDRDLRLYSTTHTACIHTPTRRKLVHAGGIKIPA